MYKYSSSNPPAPIVPVEISTVYDPDSVCNIDALIDSGADVSCIPLLVVNGLNLIPIRVDEIKGITGQKRTVGIYAINLVFNNIPFKNQTVYEVPDKDEDCVILGRDILNKLHICLDGIKGVVRVAW
jgi:clan AA aspartic protease